MLKVYCERIFSILFLFQTLTCDSTIADSFCVWGNNAGIYIEYTAYRSSSSSIILKIVPGEKPRSKLILT